MGIYSFIQKTVGGWLLSAEGLVSSYRLLNNVYRALYCSLCFEGIKIVGSM